MSSYILTIAWLLQSLEDPFLFIALIAVVTLGLGLLRKSLAVSFFASIALTFASTHIVKSIFKVMRPEDALALAQGYRFPSMHTAIGAAFLTSLAWYIYKHTPSRILRICIALFTIGLIAIIGYTRILLGVHEVVDVVVGAGIGVGISLLFHLLLRRYAPKE